MSFDYFDELAGSPTFDIVASRTTATRVARIPWSSIDAFIDYLFPAGGLVPPRLYPGTDWLRARSLHIEPYLGEQDKISTPTAPWTVSNGPPLTITDPVISKDHDVVNTYEFATVRVEYDTQVGGIQGDDPVAQLTHHWSIGGEYISLNSNGFQWSDGYLVAGDTGISAIIPTIEHSITWPMVESPPFAAIRTRLGTVNSNTMTFRTGVISPETLLFLGAELQRDILATGPLAWQVTYRFSERNVTPASDDGSTVGGWNHFYRSDSPADFPVAGGKTGFYRLKVRTGRTGAGNPIFPLLDFSPLFVQV